MFPKLLGLIMGVTDTFYLLLNKSHLLFSLQLLACLQLTPSLIISSLSDSTIPFIRRENGKLPPQFHYKNHG